MGNRSRFVAAIVMPVMLAASGFAAYAAVQPLEVLKSYVGEWTGSSTLVGGEKPEPFRCRLTISKGNQAKINYAGRCTLTNMNLSVSGTIAYSDAAQRYEAVMISNAGFDGTAVGRLQDDNITFDLKEDQTDRSGKPVNIGAHITLTGSTSITIDFEVEFNNSGNVLTATVPFEK